MPKHLTLLLLLAAACHLPVTGPGFAQAPGGNLHRPDARATDPTEGGDEFFEEVFRHAQRLAEQPYQAPGPEVPPALAALPEHATKLITYRPQNSLWSEPESWFRARLFHRGNWFDAPVQVYELADGKPELINYDPEDFDLRGVDLDASSLPKDLGYAGASFYFRHPQTGAFEEKLSFLGGTYFRAVSDHDHWGSSGRGLTINTFEPDLREEFPEFQTLWLARPEPGQRTMTLYALLNGESVTGAYRFDVSAEPYTVLRVKASLTFRRDVEKPGFAALTSMFLMGEEQPGRFGEWRHEVHDADGLLMMTRDGEHLWRPLDNPGDNPEGSRASRFRFENPRGFGLIQRDQNFDHYQDLELRYHLRPSVWVQAGDDWGAGEVELVEFHSGDEDFDNIAAYWIPEDRSRLAPGKRFDMTYALWFCDDHPPVAPGGRFVATRRGYPEALFPNRRNHQALRFVLEASGGGLDNVEAGVPEAVVSTTGGRLLGTPTVVRNEPGGTWRITLDAERTDPGIPLGIRAHLRRGNDVLTETWVYRWDWGTP